VNAFASPAEPSSFNLKWLDFYPRLIYPQIMSKRLVQLEFPRHGGRRKGAGRPTGDRVSHHPRPEFARVTPALVTLKVRNDVPSLRSSRRFAAIRQVFKAARGLNGLRIVEFSVQGNHLHLIAEADDKASLSRGMQGLNVRIARALNRLLQRSGSLFADDPFCSRARDAAAVRADPMGGLLRVGWRLGRGAVPQLAAAGRDAVMCSSS
jgi:REP element-mobilizing transposase RayT